MRRRERQSESKQKRYLSGAREREVLDRKIYEGRTRDGGTKPWVARIWQA